MQHLLSHWSLFLMILNRAVNGFSSRASFDGFLLVPTLYSIIFLCCKIFKGKDSRTTAKADSLIAICLNQYHGSLNVPMGRHLMAPFFNSYLIWFSYISTILFTIWPPIGPPSEPFCLLVRSPL